MAPGRVTRDGTSGYRVFSPFYRAWRRHGWRPPAGSGSVVRWGDGGLGSDGAPVDPPLGGVALPPAGEAAATRAWARFRDGWLRAYGERRDVLVDEGSSRLSPYLKYGCLHPRTLLAELGQGEGEESFRSELAWREFYADVL